MKINKIKNNYSGFVLLFAVMLSAIILAITLGVSSTLLKETNFSISNKDAGNAFFAADTGAECALYFDRVKDFFNLNNSIPSEIKCDGAPRSIISLSINNFEFFVNSLGSSRNACAIVSIEKTDNGGGTFSTKIVSKGYNLGGDNCKKISVNQVERELDLNY